MRIDGGRNIGRVLVALVVLSASSVAMASGAGAANPVIAVTTTADVINGSDGLVSLREAVAVANADSGNDHILLAEGATYDLAICGNDITVPDDAVGDLDATDSGSLTIQGLNGSTIHQTCPQRVLEATSGPLLLTDVSLTGGRDAGGASIRAAAPLVLDGVEVTGATVPAPSALDDGAVYATVRPVSISGSEIHHNAATGVYQCCGSVPTGFVVSDSSIHDNTVTGARSGGIDSPGNFRLIDSDVSHNTANDVSGIGGTGGGVYSLAASVLRSTISGNRARMGGGLMGGFDLTESTVTGNIATLLGGGGQGQYHLDRSTVSQNRAGFAGGGVGGGGTITGSTIASNAAADLTSGEPQPAGGVYVEGGGTVRITNSTITDNRGLVAGGVLAVQYPAGQPGPEVTVESSTLVGNEAQWRLGQPDLVGADDLAFADPGVGQPPTEFGTLSVTGSVVGSAAPEAHGACSLNQPTVISGGMNYLADDTCDLGPSVSDVVAGGDPLLSPLADHGGPTQTMPPLVGSPLIDRFAVDSPQCPSTDQRGVARPVGQRCDIGAVESDSALFAHGSVYAPLAPVRVHTRDGTGGLDPFDSGTEQTLVIGGSDCVPSNATAVVLNITGTDVDLPTYVTAFPGGLGGVRPTSSLNLEPGQTAANLVTVKIGIGGTVAFKNARGHLDLVADVMGYYYDGPVPAGMSTFTSMAPKRLGDSRDHTVLQTFGPHSTQSLAVTGGSTSVPVGASAVVVNITATDVSSPTFLTAYPKGDPPPIASNLNLDRHETRANQAIVKVGTDGSISLVNDSGSVSLIVDVVGYFTADLVHARFVPLAGSRIIDTRFGTGPLHQFGAGETQSFDATGGSVPPDATTVVVNLTVTDSVTGTFVTAYPTPAGPDLGPPNTSSVNVGPLQTTANMVTVRVGAGGMVSIYNRVGTANVIIDLVGYYR